MNSTTQDWLKPFTWEFVTAQNAALCHAKKALHKPTSDGHDATKELWDAHHQQPMTLAEVVDLCRRCHKLAPFCFFNGNTFVAIARAVIARLEMEATQAAIVRSLAGHIVAGVATDEEIKAFQKFSDHYPA